MLADLPSASSSLVCSSPWLRSAGRARPPATTHATENSLAVRVEPGWNNVVYFGAQRPVSEVIAEFGGAVTRVFVWEGTSQSWRSYHSALPFLSDLELVTPYMSLWLFSEGSGVTTWTQTAPPQSHGPCSSTPGGTPSAGRAMMACPSLMRSATSRSRPP